MVGEAQPDGERAKPGQPDADEFLGPEIMRVVMTVIMVVVIVMMAVRMVTMPMIMMSMIMVVVMMIMVVVMIVVVVFVPCVCAGLVMFTRAHRGLR